MLFSSAHILMLAQELLSNICAHIYSFGLPPCQSSLDPLITTDYGVPTSLPSSLPPGNWSEAMSRHTLAQLCLVNHSWHEAAKPWLWFKVEVRLPRSWLALVEEVVWDESTEDVGRAVGNGIQAARSASADARDLDDKLQNLIFDKYTREDEKENEPDNGIPLELLSPAASRDPSPRRLRAKSKSPARWEIMRSISNTIQDIVDRREPGLYVPIPHDPRPGRFVRHLDFNHFRTIGMRRSVNEGVNSRFVTGDRVQAVIKEMPNLATFGATEYMDGALTFPVLEELFLRGAPARGRGRPTRGRGSGDVDDDDRDRRRQCRDLEAVDLTGCVSGVFVNALTQFVERHVLNEDRRSSDDALVFPGLLRLGLRGVKSILPRILMPFVLSFPSLTHLDLSGTRATPELLEVLALSPTVRLRSVALARCVQLTGESIRLFLTSSPVTSELEELNLHGDLTFPSPLSPTDAEHVFHDAPCITSGRLVYLDVSSVPITQQMLSQCNPQPKLRSLGLSYMPNLELKAIVAFLTNKAPKVEVLTLVGTSPELDVGLRAGSAQRGSPRAASIALHTHLIRPLCTPPFSFSLSTLATAPAPPPTRLRVIELSTPMLAGLGAGAGSWRIVRSKGGRGWYVDTASGWVTESTGVEDSAPQSTLRRDLPPDHPYRKEMIMLADANGNVSSGIGWHARKMEVLHGHGMLGREDGLYGAVSFAYQG